MITGAYIQAWAVAFGLTLLLEVPFYVALAWRKAAWWHLALAGAACTCVTHPLLWFVWIRVFDLHQDYDAYILTGELAVVVIETLVFFALVPKITFARAFVVACAANLFSWGLGRILQEVGVI